MDTWVTFFGAVITHGGGMSRAFLVFDSVHSSYDIGGQPTGWERLWKKYACVRGNGGSQSAEIERVYFMDVLYDWEKKKNSLKV